MSATPAELLIQLRTLGVRLHLEDEKLRLNAPKGSLTAELQAELKASAPELIKLLRSMTKPDGRTQAAPMKRVERTEWMPLSFAQQRIWFLQQLDPASTAYNLLGVLRIEGDLNEDVLERSLKGVLLRHEALRTCFVQRDGSPYTKISDGEEWTMQRHTLKSQPDERREKALWRYVDTVVQQPYNLETGPLWRAFLLTDARAYYLVLSMHHIVSDGWSMGVAVQEIAANYKAYLSGEQPRLQMLPVQYAEYTQWQREWFNSGVLDRQVEYWRRQLKDAPPITVFPHDRKALTDPTATGRRSKHVLSASLLAEIERFSRSHDSTLFMTMLSAFMILLARYSGQKDVVVGSPSANRNRAELNELIGFFVNNLVLRAQVDDDISFLTLLQRIRETTLGAYEHQDVPFDRLVQELQVDRNPVISPLFQTMLILQNFQLDPLQLPGMTITPMEIDAITARFDLTVEMYPMRNELHLYFDYRSDLYDEATIVEIQASYEQVLRHVIAHPDTLVGRIPLLSSQQKQMLLASSVGPQTEFSNKMLLAALHHYAEETPNRMAARGGEKELTYAELAQQVNRIASRLQKAEVGRGTLVPVLLQRSTDLLAALLGVLQAGAAYVPLDPIYPKQRIAGILADVQPRIILTEPGLQSLVEEWSDRCLMFEEAKSSIAEQESLSELAPVSADDLAYVIFTSGSTGRPKGVEISHGALANLLQSMGREPGLTSSDRLLAVTTISFDIAALEFFLPIYAGAELVIAREPGNLPALLHDLDTVRPSFLQATPSLWQMLLSANWKGDLSLTALCGGEALTGDLAALLTPMVGSLWNMYGPTETTIWSSVYRVGAADKASVPIGGPIDNTQFFVLDAQLEPVPMGVAGELYIGGAGLARGYFKQSELTATRFIENPFAVETRLYRTGDLVRMRRDGLFNFLGRTDFQVKLRGFRIELGEIEHAIRQQPEIYEGVVLLRDSEGEKELVAYVVFRSGETLSSVRLQQRLREKIPEYMVPSSVVVLPSLPRLPNGKLDRSRLPAPEAVKTEAVEVSTMSGGSETELAIAKVFKELLHLQRIDPKKRFFEFGAHSLLLVRAHDRLKRTLYADLQLVSFFHYPSISSLASHVDQSLAKEEAGVHVGRT